MQINGTEAPEPMREAPPYGTWYWYPLPSNLDGVSCSLWKNDAFDTKRLRRGICHSTEDAARKHFEALIAPSMADAQPNSVEIDGTIPGELSSTSPDRQQQRFELVKAALTGLIAHHRAHHNQLDDSRLAIEYADRALAELERTK